MKPCAVPGMRDGAAVQPKELGMFRLSPPVAIGILCTALAAATAGMAGCQGQHNVEDTGVAPEREPLHGMQVTFFRVRDGERRWVELAISVDRSKTLRMPVFFRKDGKVVDIDDQDAAALLDEWIKDRAEGVAVFGTIGMDFGQATPAVNIEVARLGARR
jgi:hypothetical protein